MSKSKRCDIIMPVWNELEHTKECIKSVRNLTSHPYRLIIIDNNSDDETKDYLARFAQSENRATLIRNEENLGFIKAANQGLRISDGPYICLMNNDTVATAGWLSNMVAIAESNPKIGLVNPRSESPGSVSLEEYAEMLSQNKGLYIETNQCMGFCMLIKREVIDRIGILDEAYGIGGFDDTDFSRRADLAGYKCVCAQGAYVYHDWHTSFNRAGNRRELVKKNEEIFVNKWGRYLRIGYPIFCNDNELNFYVDVNTSLGLAREWNWVHAWLNGTRLLESRLRFLKLPEHQNLRLFNMSGPRYMFYAEVLFRLIERRLKRKKHFDVIFVSDRNLFKLLTAFKRLISVPVVYLEADRPDFKGMQYRDEEFWRKRAKEIVKSVKK